MDVERRRVRAEELYNSPSVSDIASSVFRWFRWDGRHRPRLSQRDLVEVYFLGPLCFVSAITAEQTIASIDKGVKVMRAMEVRLPGLKT